MAKPSIGAAVIPEQDQNKKNQVKELTVLGDNAKESIFHLVLSGESDRS